MKTTQKFLLLFGALLIISFIGQFETYGYFSNEEELQFNSQENNTPSLTSEDQGLNSAPANNETEKFPCSTFDEWRAFLLDHYNTTLEELSELHNSSIAILNEEARIYTGWSNGTYTDEEKSQLLQDLHNTPRIAFGVFPFTDISLPSIGGIFPNLHHHTDQYFECIISVQNFIAGEHIFRVYAYIDYDTSDTDKNYPNNLLDYFYGFTDGDSSKVFPASIEWWNYLGKYPWDADLNPNEAWMGPDTTQILKVDKEQFWAAQSYTAKTHPHRIDDQINFVIQVMWRWDEVVGFGLWKPWFKWVTRQADVYRDWRPGHHGALTPFNIYDDDQLPPILTSLVYDRTIYDSAPHLTVSGTAIDYSGLAIHANYYGEVIQGLWIPLTQLFIIWLPTDRIGYHQIPLFLTDLDNDRPNDRMVSGPYYVSYTVYDDDLSPPSLSLQHSGATTDEDPGYLQFKIYEPNSGSQATATLTIEGPNDFIYSNNYGEGIYTLDLKAIGVSEPGVYSFTLYAENNDEDRGEIDEESREILRSLTIIDDDEVEPEIFEVLFPDTLIKDSDDSFKIRVDATDESGIDWVRAYCNGGGPYYGMYDFLDGYYWITIPNPRIPFLHSIHIQVADNDNDREEDQLISYISETIGIFDDDITPPTINYIDLPDIVYDYEHSLSGIINVYDASGIHQVKAYLNGQEYNLGSIGPFNIPSPKKPGEYQLIIKAWDNDYDFWEGDRMIRTYVHNFEILDDDERSPSVDLISGDMIWEGMEINFNFRIIAYDDSDIGDVLIKIGEYQFYDLEWHDITLSEGIHTMKVWVSDGDNDRPGDSMTTYREFFIVLDLTPPTTTATPTGNLELNGWYTSDVSVFLEAEDLVSGVDFTCYNVNSNGWVTGVGPISITENGITTIEFYSTDNVGNVEATKSIKIKIDKVPPETTPNFDEEPGLNGWYTSDLTIFLTATDDHSGVAYTQYNVNGAGWITDSGLISIPITEDGTTTIEFYSTDNAGNVEAIKSINIMIDKTDPITTLTLQEPNHGLNPTYISSSTRFLLDATDNDPGSGIDIIEYLIDGCGWTPYTSAFSISGIGSHTVFYRSIDKAGNIETEKSVVVIVNASELKYLGGFEGIYSDPVILKANLSDIATGLPIPGKMVYFTIKDQTVSAITQSDGIAYATLILDQCPVNDYTVFAFFEGDEEYLLSDSEECEFIINKEYVYAEYTGDMVVPLDANFITLRATVFDDDDGNWGNLTKIYANISILDSWTLETLYTVSLLEVKVTIVDGVGVAQIIIGNDLLEGDYLVQVSFNSNENDYYWGDISLPGVLIIYNPTGDFVTGGGWIEDTNGNRGNFGFNIKYKKNGLPKGQAIYVYREDGYVYIVKANAWVGMAIISEDNYTIFEAKCNIKQINATTGEIVWEDGNYRLIIEAWDNSKDGKGDIIQIRVFDKIGLIYYESGFDPFGFLRGGNIVIHIDEKK